MTEVKRIRNKKKPFEYSKKWSLRSVFFLATLFLYVPIVVLIIFWQHTYYCCSGNGCECDSRYVYRYIIVAISFSIQTAGRRSGVFADCDS